MMNRQEKFPATSGCSGSTHPTLLTCLFHWSDRAALAAAAAPVYCASFACPGKSPPDSDWSRASSLSSPHSSRSQRASCWRARTPRLPRATSHPLRSLINNEFILVFYSIDFSIFNKYILRYNSEVLKSNLKVVRILILYILVYWADLLKPELLWKTQNYGCKINNCKIVRL